MLARILSALLFLALPATALEAPRTSPVLTVTGDISTTNAQDAALFDRDMLEALEWVEVTTYTSFTEGPQVFSGPTLASLLDLLGVASGTLRATAVNDYSVEIPVADAALHGVILAMDHNGRRMRLRDKGPIWVVYPLTKAEARKKPFDGEMIWQLVRLDVTS